MARSQVGGLASPLRQKRVKTWGGEKPDFCLLENSRGCSVCCTGCIRETYLSRGFLLNFGHINNEAVKAHLRWLPRSGGRMGGRLPLYYILRPS